MVVLLNTNAPNSSTLLFDAFIISKEFENTFIQFMHIGDDRYARQYPIVKAMPYIDFDFLNQNKSIDVVENKKIPSYQSILNVPFMLRLCCTNYYNGFNNINQGGLREPIPFSENFARVGLYGGGASNGYISAFITTDEGVGQGIPGVPGYVYGKLQKQQRRVDEWSYPMYIMPLFRHQWSALVTPTIVIREYATLDKQDFANLTDISITFSDWQERFVLGLKPNFELHITQHSHYGRLETVYGEGIKGALVEQLNKLWSKNKSERKQVIQEIKQSSPYMNPTFDEMYESMTMKLFVDIYEATMK